MFCTNCGKKIPDGTPGGLCEACAAAKAAEVKEQPAARPAEKPAEKAKASDMLKKSGKGPKKAGGRGLMHKVKIWVASIVAGATVLGVGTYAALAPTKEERMMEGIGEVLMAEDRYTLSDLAVDLLGELSAPGRQGGTQLGLDLSVPGLGSANLNLGLRSSGKKAGLTLEGDLMGTVLDRSTLYLDKDQAAFDLLDQEQYYSVRFDDLLRSAVLNQELTQEEADRILTELPELIFSAQENTEELSKAFGKCLKEALPGKTAKKGGKTEWNGGTYATYEIKLDNGAVRQILLTLGDQCMADPVIRPYLDDLVTVAKKEGELQEDFDLNTAWSDTKTKLQSLELVNGFKLTTYMEGRSCVGFEGKITNILGERTDVTFRGRNQEQDSSYKRAAELLIVDDRNREYGIRYNGNWNGNDMDCTERGILTVTDGYDSEILDIRMNHRAEGSRRSDEIQVEGVTVKHQAEGSWRDSKYSCELSTNVLGTEAKLKLDYSKRDTKVTTPKSVVLTDGSADYFSEDALKQLEKTVYEVTRLLERVDKKVG